MPDDKEISNLDPLEVMASDDLFVVVSSGATKKIEKNKAATSIKLDDLGTPDDNTDLNATTSKHGLLKKLDNNSSKFMNGQGSWAVPPGVGLPSLIYDTTPQLGGNLDLNQKSIVLDPTPDSDHTFNGPSFTGTSGMALALFDVCILQADGKYDKADGDAEVTTKGMCVMAAETFAGDASTGVMILPGSFIRDDTFAYTVGAKLYLPLTPGPPTETIPPAAGDFVRVMGYARSATVIFFNPSPDYFERV